MTIHDSATTNDLIQAPLGDLARAAFTKARDAHGYVVTYSPKVFIPLTKLCRDRCGYCTFAQAPAHVSAPYMSLDEVMEVAQAGKQAGCTEALFTLGERPELRYDEAARWLAARGYHSTVDYVANAAQMVLEGTWTPSARQRRCAVRSRTAPTSRCERVPGHDARVTRHARRASTRARQGPSAQARHASLRRRAEDPLHDGTARGHR